MSAKSNGWWLPLRFALRELRAGMRGFYVFLGCIALGSMAIAASQAARLSGSGRERVKKSSMLLLFLCLSKYAIAEARTPELA